MSNRNGIHYKGASHPNWKGNDVGYISLHEWMRANFPKIGRCEHCGKKKKTHYACKGHHYTRLRRDWLELCVKCHRDYDGVSEKMRGRVFSDESRAKMSASAKRRANTPKGKARLRAAYRVHQRTLKNGDSKRTTARRS